MSIQTAFHACTTCTLTLEDDLKLAKTTGYDGVVTTFAKIKSLLNAAGHKVVKELVKENGVNIFGIANIPVDMTKVSDNKLDEIKAVSQLAKIIKTGFISITPKKGTPVSLNEKEIIATYAESFKQIAEAAAVHDQTVLIEPEKTDQYLCNPVMATYIMQKSGGTNLGLAFDSFEFQKAGIIIESLETIERDFNIVYLADAPAIKRLKEHDRLKMGDGVLDFERLFRIIKENEYEGPFVVKLCVEKTTKARSKSFLRKARENLREFTSMIEYL